MNDSNASGENRHAMIGNEAAEGVLRGLCMPEHETVRITWWDEDGTERTGWANVSPEASPETLMALTHMMQSLDVMQSGDTGQGRSEEAFRDRS